MTDQNLPETNGEYTFRRMILPDDSDLLITIHRIYDQEYGFTREPVEYEILVRYLSDHASVYHPFVLLDGSMPAGYIRAYDRLSTSSCDVVLMLDLVYIIPRYRGMGLGKIIMKHFIDFAVRNRKARIDLLSDHDNPAAIKLYQHYGFRGRDRHQMILFIKDQSDLLDYFQKKLERDQA